MRKLTISLLLLALGATIGIGWIFDELYSTVNDELAQHHLDASHHIQELGQHLGNALNVIENKDRFLLTWNTKPHPYSIEIVTLDDIKLSTQLQHNLMQGKGLILEGASGLSFYYYMNNSDEILVLHTPALDPKQSVNPLHLALTGMFYGLLLLMFFLWAYPLKKRLTALRQAAKEFGQGKLHRRVDPSPTSYIGEIEHEFNRMAQRIENLVGDVKLLSSSISHEMRTPLAKIQFGLDALAEETDPEVRKDFELRIGKTVAEMTSMVDRLLQYGRLDYAMATVTKQEIDLGDIVKKCVEKYSGHSFTLEYEEPGLPCLIQGDEVYLEILVDNLVGNAVKYGRTMAHITLVKTSVVTVAIADDGDGIVAGNIDDIFLPFFRGTNKADSSDGFGIGLAVANRIASWHQAILTVHPSSTLSGAEFTITFPLQDNDDKPRL